jgi:hypothetical protein
VLELERGLSFYEAKCRNLERVNGEMNEEKLVVVGKVQQLEGKLVEAQKELESMLGVIKERELGYV